MFEWTVPKLIDLENWQGAKTRLQQWKKWKPKPGIHRKKKKYCGTALYIRDKDMKVKKSLLQWIKRVAKEAQVRVVEQRKKTVLYVNHETQEQKEEFEASWHSQKIAHPLVWRKVTRWTKNLSLEQRKR